MLVIGGIHPSSPHGDGYLAATWHGDVDRDLPEYLRTTEADRDPSGSHSRTMPLYFYGSKFYRI
jgi:hypothetical protein